MINEKIKKRLNERLRIWNTSNLRLIRKDNSPYLLTAAEREEIVDIITEELKSIFTNVVVSDNDFYKPRTCRNQAIECYHCIRREQCDDAMW